MQCSHCAGCSLTTSQALTSSIQQRAGEAYKSEIVLKERVGAEQCGPAGNEFTFLVFSQCLASECLASRCSPWLCLDGYLCPGHSFKRSRGLALWGKWWHAHPKGVVGGEAVGTQSCPCSARGDIRKERRNELIKMALQPPAGTPAEADCVQCVMTRAESSPAPTVI